MNLTTEEILSLSREDLEKLDTETLELIRAKLQAEADNDHVMQLSLKILINSLYGALANKHFVLSNPDFAAAITSSGRFFIQNMSNHIERKLQSLLPSKDPYVVYNDTDSAYYTIASIVERKFGKNPEITNELIDWCDNFEKKVIQPTINEAIEDYANILNIKDPSKVGVEREIIADSAVFVAKKKYFARVLDSEGVRFNLDDPYIKVMGLEIARSSTPPWVKKKLKEAIPVILDSSESGLKEWKDKVRSEYQDQPLELICAVQGISNLDYSINDKGIPQGSRSGLVHNEFIKKAGLEDIISPLIAGERYKRCYLKEPNVFGSDIVSFEDSKILDIIRENDCFDYSMNFKKQFEASLDNMIKVLNYDLSDKPKFNLDDW